MAAAAGPVDPISIPTVLGAREVLDVGVTSLNLQKIENPQHSLHACASRYGPQTIRSLFEKLEQMDKAPPFTEINLSDNNIGDEGAAWLLKGLTSKTSKGEVFGKGLKQLIMPRARLGIAGMKSIGGVIGASTSLETVILSGNTTDVDGSQGVKGEFCDGLSKNKSVKSLCLAACRLGDTGVAALAEGPLKSHPTLEHLSIAYNRLELAAATSLAAMLETNQALRFLDLTGNSLGPEGAEALLKGLKKNKGRLQQLSLATNSIQYKGAKAFCDHFMSADGKSLVYLDLRHNQVPFAKIAQLRKDLGKPLDGPDNAGWMMVFGERQLLLHR